MIKKKVPKTAKNENDEIKTQNKRLNKETKQKVVNKKTKAGKGNSSVPKTT